ncbi:recombinase family protein [Terrabacter aeriphilus]|uniref:Recombinase family protein n=1 Tax=Terrabacter aeriphilus TaxID=515662 RepID=A0ABP9JLJ6_9MICO
MSIHRQVEAAEQYAAARGWPVVATFKDDGVSATHNRPADRAGWRELLSSPVRFDAVIIWKVDRLARRVLDFLQSHEDLQDRDAGIVAVEQSIDMTTPEGRAFAQMLAVFGEMEAGAISARVKAARNYLIRAGRVVGGRLPYGWRSVPNPDGPGRIWAQDPDRIEYVRGMVDRVRRGDSVYSVTQWLDEAAAPTPTGKGSGWQYSSVERILRHPILAGMIPHNPGNDGKVRGEGVLRGDDGLPVVMEDVAILTLAEWRNLIRSLDERDSGQSRPRAMRAKTSGLLSGLLFCGEHLDDDGSGTRMWRGTVQGRPSYSCPVCYQAISNFEQVVIDEFLRQKGDWVRWSVVEEVHEGGAAMLPEIEHRLTELEKEIRDTRDRAARRALQDQQASLLDLRDEAEASAPTVRLVPVRGTQHFAEDWADATTPEDQRVILGDAVERIWVTRGRPGRRTEAQVLARLSFEWRNPESLGPIETPDDADLALWASNR